ncbi:hypothetical protein VTI74DRAFT_7035 [Chaetomium olivicolor]
MGDFGFSRRPGDHFGRCEERWTLRYQGLRLERQRSFFRGGADGRRSYLAELPYLWDHFLACAVHHALCTRPRNWASTRRFVYHSGRSLSCIALWSAMPALRLSAAVSRISHIATWNYETLRIAYWQRRGRWLRFSAGCALMSQLRVTLMAETAMLSGKSR